MADMSKISPDAGQTIYNLKDANARANKWDKSSQKVAGAYNLLQNTWTTAVISNVTVTKNTDGTLSTSGTSNAADDDEIAVAVLQAGTYKLTGCPTGGGSSAYRFKAINKTSGNTVIGYDDGDGLTITLAADATIGVNLVFASGVPMAGKTFKPMIAPDLSASYSDYVPYCMSNKDITDALKYHPGDTVRIGNSSYEICVGMITGRDDQCQLSIRLPKELGDDIQSFSVSDITPGPILSINGLVSAPTLRQTEGPVIFDTSIRITVNFAGTPFSGITSWTPILVYFKATITFS